MNSNVISSLTNLGAIAGLVIAVWQFKEMSKEIDTLKAEVASIRTLSKGPKGDPGPQGLPGEKGPTGPRGDQGLRGEKGETGTSPAVAEAALKSLEARLAGLERSKNLAVTFPTPVASAVVSSPSAWKPGTCFNKTPNEPLDVTIVIRVTGKKDVLCWRDGSVMAELNRFTDRSLQVDFPGNGGRWINFGEEGNYQLQQGRLKTKAEKLILDGETAVRIRWVFQPH